MPIFELSVKAEISDIDDKTSMFKMMRNKQENKSWWKGISKEENQIEYLKTKNTVFEI